MEELRAENIRQRLRDAVVPDFEIKDFGIKRVAPPLWFQAVGACSGKALDAGSVLPALLSRVLIGTQPHDPTIGL